MAETPSASSRHRGSAVIARPEDMMTPRTRQEQAIIKHAQSSSSSLAGGRSLNRQRILSEDEYTEALERIIARDFFPSLYKSQQQQQRVIDEIRRGLSSTDDMEIQQSVRRVQSWMEMDDRSKRGSVERLWTPSTEAAGGASTPSTVQVGGRRQQRRNLGQTPIYGPGGTIAQTPIYNDYEDEDDDYMLEDGEIEPRSRIKKRQKAEADRLGYDPHLSLDDFQARYTSEDNASFSQIIDEENTSRRSKYAWAFEAEKKANDKARRAIEAREQLVSLARRLAAGDPEVRLIEGLESSRPGERLLIEGRESLPGDSASIEFAKRRMVAAPPLVQEKLLIKDAPSSNGSRERASEEQPMTAKEREAELQLALKEKEDEVSQSRAESRDAGVIQTWPTTARNSLFFAPDANVPVHKVAQHPLSQPKRVIGGGPAAKDELGITEPKGIRHDNTRIVNQEDLEEAARQAGVPSSPSHSNIAAAISGTPYPGRTSMTPRVQGYSFVDAMPSPTVSQLGDSGLAALMTFGTLASTPVALRDPNANDPALEKKEPTPMRPSDDPNFEGPFKIPRTSRREALAHKLASKAAKSLQKRHHLGGGASSSSITDRDAKSALGLRNAVGSSRSSSSSLSVAGWETPRSEQHRSSRDTLPSGTGGDRMPSSSTTPARDAFLSPAARTLLGRTSTAKRAADSSPFAVPRLPASARSGTMSIAERERERESLERVKRARWDASPVVSAGKQQQQ